MNAELPVETSGLTRRYGDLLAVSDLDLRVGPGEVYGFLGPNGAGKTTTLRMLLGLIRPTAGEARILGRRPGRGHLARVGALIEGPAFYPYLSGRANLRVVARHAAVPLAEVDRVLELVDLTKRGKDRYAAYSLGMKQRLGLAAALLKRPALLILDEPTNGLDPAGMADMRLILRNLAGEECMVMLSSHLLGEVQQICDRVGVISGGQLIAQLPVNELVGRGVLRLRATPTDRAHECLTELAGQPSIHRVDGVFDFAVTRDQAARINAELVRFGVQVSELRWHEPTLEEMFLQLTGGDDDVA